MTVTFDSGRPGQATTVIGGRVRLRTLIAIRWVAIVARRAHSWS